MGDEVEVRLESNPTTGYGWVVAAQPEAVELLSSDFQAPDTELVGAERRRSPRVRGDGGRFGGRCDWSTCGRSTIRRSRPSSSSTSFRVVEAVRAVVLNHIPSPRSPLVRDVRFPSSTNLCGSGPAFRD